MSEAIKKIAELENVIVEVKVSEISGQSNFLGFATLNHFDPSQMMEKGGPVTKKVVNTQALGDSYDEAYNNALQKAVELMGL